MQLCKKCGTLMLPVKKHGKATLLCPKCKIKGKMPSESFKISEKIEKDIKDTIPVIEADMSNLPKMKITCPECEHREAWWWTKQTRSSDEPETRFYRCVKCRKTWREYS